MAIAAGLTLQVAAATPGFADAVISGGCIRDGGWFQGGGSNCVTTIRKGPIGPVGIYQVEEPKGKALEEAMERDRKWLARCKPVIQQDTYGVGRYIYAASGCEFGKFED
jgi:hypothetical protein